MSAIALFNGPQEASQLYATVNRLITLVNAMGVATALTYTYPGSVDFPTPSNPVPRTVASRLSDIMSLKDFGAIGDGVANDSDAATSAFASNWRTFVPVGVYNCPDLTAGALPFAWGDGQMVDSGGNKRARYFTYLNDVTGSVPTTYGNWGSVLTAFNGDASQNFTQFPTELRATGTTTLGQPGLTSAAIYLQRPENSTYAAYGFFDSGYNHLTTGSGGGRTGVSVGYFNTYQRGQGDAGCLTLSGFIDSPAKVGATNFLANGAVFLINGGISAGSNYSYLNMMEFRMTGGAYDVAGIGLVVNFDRDVYNGGGAGQQYVWWAGIRLQSVGDVAIDTFWSVSGKARHGVDLSFGDFSSNSGAAITVKSGQYIFWDVTATDASGSSRYPSALGTVKLGYDGTDLALTGGLSISGRLKFGTFTGSGDVAVNGSVAIVDAAGNARKLATVA